MDRDRIFWGFACYSCMSNMSTKLVRQICRRNRDVFVIRGKKVKFTKQFLNEATKMDSVS